MVCLCVCVLMSVCAHAHMLTRVLCLWTQGEMGMHREEQSGNELLLSGLFSLLSISASLTGYKN